MSDITIDCPACKTTFPLTEQLAGPLIAETRQRLEAQAFKDLEAEKAKLAAEAKVAAEAAQVEQLARLKAQAAAVERRQTAEAADLKARLEAATADMAEMRQTLADATRRERTLAEREEALSLEVQKQVNAALVEERERLRQAGESAVEARVAQATDEAQRKLTEKEAQIDIMRNQIEALKRKSEQGSMQVQGEAAEVLLEDRLRRAFPGDDIAPVGKGLRGADIVQDVRSFGGRTAGRILWEVKQAQNWSPGWLAKLRDDARDQGAEAMVLVSSARPKDADSFALLDGVHVCAPGYALPLAAVLRQMLVDLDEARGAREGQESKMEAIYAYLTGPQFRARITAIAERFAEMQDELAQERRLTQQRWARREKQIDAALNATLGLHGDLQGIAGRAIPTIDALEPAALPDPGAG